MKRMIAQNTRFGVIYGVASQLCIHFHQCIIVQNKTLVLNFLRDSSNAFDKFHRIIF